MGELGKVGVGGGGALAFSFSDFLLDAVDGDLCAALSDPYCVVLLGRKTAKTKVIQGNLSPVWNEVSAGWPLALFLLEPLPFLWHKLYT